MNTGRSLTRRDFLKRVPAAGAALTIPGILAACSPEEPATSGSASPTAVDTGSIEGARIKVSTYGGFFEENFSTF